MTVCDFAAMRSRWWPAVRRGRSGGDNLLMVFSELG